MCETANKLTSIPEYNITKLNFQEVPVPGMDKMAMAADVSISAFNPYPVRLDIPQLGFEVLVPNCAASDPYIMVADAASSVVSVRPHSDVSISVHGLIQDIPESLTSICPNSNSSPLDLFLERYMKGEAATMFVRGKKNAQETPGWIGEIISSVTVPVPFPGRTFDSLIRNFSLTDAHFSLPDPDAEPGDPDADPTVSGTIVVTAALPSEMNFDLNVTEVRARADVIFQGDKLGELKVEEWQPASSTRMGAGQGQEVLMEIQSRIEKAPLQVTDGDVLTDVIQALLFHGKPVMLDVKALVDVRVQTVLGQLELKDVPAEGKVPLKRPYSIL